MSKAKIRILCVDDDPNVLSGLARQLQFRYEVVTVLGGQKALETFTERGPFPIIVSDMRMPEMDGATLLGKIRQHDNDTVRILLTGLTDLNSAIMAVNEGHIFRFLTKPCLPDVMNKALQAAEEQYRLITAEKILLEQTLQGSIETLADVLALASPDIFTQANRMKVYLRDLLPYLKIKDKWCIEVAVMLSRIGAITLPDDVMQQIGKKMNFQPDEQAMVDSLASIGARLLSHIPRLESVREIILYQDKHFDGSGLPHDTQKGIEIPLGARILKILLDYERLASQGYDVTYIFDTLHGRKGWYDEEILKKFATLNGELQRTAEIRELPVSALLAGMILTENLLNPNGICLIRGGVEITGTLLTRIQNIAKHGGVKEPIRVKLLR